MRLGTQAHNPNQHALAHMQGDTCRNDTACLFRRDAPTPAAVKKDLRRRMRRYIYVYIPAALYIVRFIYLHIYAKRGDEKRRE